MKKLKKEMHVLLYKLKKIFLLGCYNPEGLRRRPEGGGGE
jgi:hypothetical protein